MLLPKFRCLSEVGKKGFPSKFDKSLLRNVRPEQVIVLMPTLGKNVLGNCNGNVIGNDIVLYAIKTPLTNFYLKI